MSNKWRVKKSADDVYEAQLKAQVEALRRITQEMPCAVCGRESVVGAMFVPYDQEAFDGMPGKWRVFPYALCEYCASDPNSHDWVERSIIETLKRKAPYQGFQIDVEGNTKRQIILPGTRC